MYIPRTPFLAIIVPVGKTIHDAETFYVVVEGQVVINGVEIIEALRSCEPILLT
jgi:hypothetical protein